MNYNVKETINKISAYGIFIAGIIDIIAGVVCTIVRYTQVHDELDLDSFLLELSFDNLDFAIILAIVFLIALSAFIKKDLDRLGYLLLTVYSAVVGFLTFLFMMLGIIFMTKENTELLILYIIIYITLLIYSFCQLFSNKIMLVISKIAICSTVLLVLCNDVEKWHGNPVSRIANYIFFIALAIFTFTLKNNKKIPNNKSAYPIQFNS